ncbi:unnamed protein product, partial [Ectocarpus sp. 6 AP-2014]
MVSTNQILVLCDAAHVLSHNTPSCARLWSEDTWLASRPPRRRQQLLRCTLFTPPLGCCEGVVPNRGCGLFPRDKTDSTACMHRRLLSVRVSLTTSLRTCSLGDFCAPVSKIQGLPKAAVLQVPSDKRGRTPSGEKEQLANRIARRLGSSFSLGGGETDPPPFEHHGLARNWAAFPFASAAASSIETPLASAIAPHTRRSSSAASLAGARLSVSIKIRESGTTLST